jgi:hypothetical protein
MRERVEQTSDHSQSGSRCGANKSAVSVGAQNRSASNLSRKIRPKFKKDVLMQVTDEKYQPMFRPKVNKISTAIVKLNKKRANSSVYDYLSKDAVYTKN